MNAPNKSRYEIRERGGMARQGRMGLKWPRKEVDSAVVVPVESCLASQVDHWCRSTGAYPGTRHLKP